MSVKNVEAGLLAFALTVLLVPFVKRACERWGILDQPGPLKIHSRPVARLGGIAIAISIAAGVLAGSAPSFEKWPIFLAFALVWLVGLIDDVRRVPPLCRLAVQIFSALLLWSAGLRLAAGGNIALSLLGTCAPVVAFVNSINLWDGADGLAAGVTPIAALAFLFAPNHAATASGKLLACSLAGACLGFLIFSFPPAKIFMGDSGSTLLGLALAFLALDFYRTNSSSLPVALFPLLVAALPLLDATLAVIRRISQRRSPFEGDRYHAYDLLLARGWPPRGVALLCYAAAFAIATVALLALRTNEAAFLLLDALLLAALLIAAIRLGALRREELHKDSGAHGLPLLPLPPVK
jgi:UDP-GlcNAc:undecaprenyl-phosphate/decaprenyl-phosphate GlcNAc-1-phosphate transferase